MCSTFQLLEGYIRKFYPSIIRLVSKRPMPWHDSALCSRDGTGFRNFILQMSDGMLRYICLLAVLINPAPPPLICIEEPEIGLHPDVIHIVASLLAEASTRTQLIVTTHSDILVSALSDMPEAIVVCERDIDGTYFKG